jgi:hypothetical protein
VTVAQAAGRLYPMKVWHRVRLPILSGLVEGQMILHHFRSI